MSFESERLAIEKRFKTYWTNGIAVVYDNVKHTPVSGTPFCKLSIQNISSSKLSLGSYPGIRKNGLVFIGIYVPEHDGTKNIRTYLDTAIEIFQNQSFDGITFRTAYQASPSFVTNGWYSMIVGIPYFYDGVS